jgi:ABC-type amino acid transport substrate-binding protein
MSRPLCAVVFSLLAAGFFPRNASADLDAVKKRGALRVLVVDGSPAFIRLQPGGDRPGFEREILDGFARLQGLRVELIEVPTWEALIPWLMENKGDIIGGGVNDNAARREVIDFTSEVFPTRDVVVTRRPTLPILTLEELRAAKVGTIKGTTLAARVAEMKVPRANIVDGLPATGFPEALRSGRVTAVLDGVEDALLLKQADDKFDLGMFVGPPGSMAFGVRKTDPALRGALSDYVANVRKTATWSRLVIKYFGESAADVLKKARGE